MGDSTTESGILNQFENFKKALRAGSSFDIKRVIDALLSTNNSDDAFLRQQLEAILNVASEPDVKPYLEKFFSDPKLSDFEFAELMKQNINAEELKSFFARKNYLQELKDYFAKINAQLGSIKDAKFYNSMFEMAKETPKDFGRSLDSRCQQGEYVDNGGTKNLGLMAGRLMTAFVMLMAKASGLEINLDGGTEASPTTEDLWKNPSNGLIERKPGR